ncbi:DUF3223 domain-containing protein [Cephalotus follicularis]|uniref:DUF3223 domain-containing protein n=1 Tax=Cephalotus follicularis TaxID=3775 RepID=A0A1Q3AYZ4_CEPFO|nr:DUF3223 domain-containing protein [Cephalotus follicularis]
MAEEEAALELANTNSERVNPSTEDMDLETQEPAPTNQEGKRAREEGDEGVSKKQKVEKEKLVEENREEDKNVEGEGGEEEEETGRVSLGSKSFGSSVEMFDYFYKLLHYWPPNLNINKYEQLVLIELLKKGHEDSDKKIGVGIQAFQVRTHPTWKSKCFFLIRDDDSVDDFSFRKCVDHILPLPEDMKIKFDANKALGGGKGQGGKGGGAGRGNWRGRGRGKGGKGRN